MVKWRILLTFVDTKKINNMKKLLLLFTVVLFSIVIKAQTPQSFILDSTSVSQYSYCEIVGTKGMFTTKVTVEIDFGQATKFWSSYKSKVYKDPATGEPKIFNSMVDAMNFMGVNGWEFTQAYIIGDSHSGYVYHFLLKRYNKKI